MPRRNQSALVSTTEEKQAKPDANAAKTIEKPLTIQQHVRTAHEATIAFLREIITLLWKVLNIQLVLGDL